MGDISCIYIECLVIIWLVYYYLVIIIFSINRIIRIENYWIKMYNLIDYKFWSFIFMEIYLLILWRLKFLKDWIRSYFYGYVYRIKSV